MTIIGSSHLHKIQDTANDLIQNLIDETIFLPTPSCATASGELKFIPFIDASCPFLSHNDLQKKDSCPENEYLPIYVSSLFECSLFHFKCTNIFSILCQNECNWHLSYASCILLCQYVLPRMLTIILEMITLHKTLVPLWIFS